MKDTDFSVSTILFI